MRKGRFLLRLIALAPGGLAHTFAATSLASMFGEGAIADNPNRGVCFQTIPTGMPDRRISIVCKACCGGLMGIEASF